MLANYFQIAETFNNYFQNLVPNLDLQVSNNFLYQTPRNSDYVSVTIFKYQNHPSIKTTCTKCNFSFPFKTVSLTDIEKKIRRLDTSKPSHTFDIFTKMLKQNIDFFSPFKLGYINKSIMSFTSILKLADVTSVYKKDSEYGVTTSLLVFYLIYPKLLKTYCITKFSHSLKTFSANIKLASGKALICEIV